MTDQSEVSAFVDYEHRQFVARDGTRLTLRPIPKLILERLYNDESGKPKVPTVEVEIGGKYKRTQPNPDDPAYKQALDAWISDKNIGLARYLVESGVEEPAPPEFIEQYRAYAPHMAESGLKYLWVLSLFGATDEEQMAGLKQLSEAITGQTAVTEAGLKKAEDSFPGNGEREPAEPVPAGQAAG